MDIKHELIGKTKAEILAILGDQLNVPFSKIWYYDAPKLSLLKITYAIYFDTHNVSYRVDEITSIRYFGFIFFRRAHI